MVVKLGVGSVDAVTPMEAVLVGVFRLLLVGIEVYPAGRARRNTIKKNTTNGTNHQRRMLDDPFLFQPIGGKSRFALSRYDTPE